MRVDPVAVTWAPKALANCTAKWPTPPLPAWMSIRCPGAAAARSTTMPHAVSAATGTAAASTWLSRTGLRVTFRLETVTSSA